MIRMKYIYISFIRCYTYFLICCWKGTFLIDVAFFIRVIVFERTQYNYSYFYVFLSLYWCPCTCIGRLVGFFTRIFFLFFFYFKNSRSLCDRACCRSDGCFIWFISEGFSLKKIWFFSWQCKARGLHAPEFYRKLHLCNLCGQLWKTVNHVLHHSRIASFSLYWDHLFYYRLPLHRGQTTDRYPREVGCKRFFGVPFSYHSFASVLLCLRRPTSEPG